LLLLLLFSAKALHLGDATALADCFNTAAKPHNLTLKADAMSDAKVRFNHHSHLHLHRAIEFECMNIAAASTLIDVICLASY
jgi:hypothetical protein